MDVRRLTVKDWLTSREYGCQLSYEEYRELYAEQRCNIEAVVSAWCKHFMKRKNDE